MSDTYVGPGRTLTFVSRKLFPGDSSVFPGKSFVLPGKSSEFPGKSSEFPRKSCEFPEIGSNCIRDSFTTK